MTNQTSLMRDTSSRSSDNLSSPRGESGIAQLRRRIAATAGGDRSGAGLGFADPFAEIFASIAAAESPAPPPATPADSINANQDRTETAEETDRPDDEAPPTAEAVPGVAVKPVLSVDVESKADDEVETPPIVAAANSAATAVESSETDDRDPGAKGTAETETQDDLRNEQLPIGTERSGNTTDETDADPQSVSNASGERDRNRPNTAEVDAAEINVVDEDAHAEVQKPPSENARIGPETQQRSETTQETADGPTADDRTEPTETRVERRRYSDPSQQQDASDPGSGGEQRSAPESNVPTKPRVEAAAEAGRSSGSAGTGGVDISGMTPVSGSSPLNSAAVSAAAQTTAAAASGAGGRSVAATATTGTSTTSSSTSGETASAFSLNANGKPGQDTKNASETKKTPGVDTTAAVERARLAQRVSRGFQHLGSGGGQIRMKLSPDHLGTVQLQMTIRDGKLNGKMVTQSDAATDILREQLPGLRASLETQGIRLERIDIETETPADRSRNETDSGQSQDPSGGFADQQFAKQQNTAGGRYRKGWSDVTPTRRTEASSPAAPAPITSLPILPGSVDLQV